MSGAATVSVTYDLYLALALMRKRAMRSLVATKRGCLQLGDGRSKMRWRRSFASKYININNIGSDRILSRLW